MSTLGEFCNYRFQVRCVLRERRFLLWLRELELTVIEIILIKITLRIIEILLPLRLIPLRKV
ncbi:uncharacterized protein DS421_19g657590 [Arachis hypogaea]|uniref:Uncharacterized protein n=1 Tax=Arachis hypogaea TaxID=3818 RepID=A0A6B9V8B4_ARAHY|nr:uncharacterized protein DS421_19g657590 [Arachis hypogaea]